MGIFHMAQQSNQYRPDYAVPPGWVLDEHLQVLGISQAEFARRCGRSSKLISEIVSGKAPVEPATALQFEKVLGLDASIWLGIEAEYRLFKERETEVRNAALAINWTKRFPIRELVRRGILEKGKSDTEKVQALLSFFGVASVSAWQERYSTLNIAYRRSDKFESSREALLTWLRLGEIEARQQPCENFNETDFRRAMREIRGLTLIPIEKALPEAQRLCNSAGVALVLVPPLLKTAVSGACMWYSRTNAMLALSARHKSNDHLWFSFFHEAAHILLHGRKRVFVDTLSKDSSNIEKEADNWALNALVPRLEWKQFISQSPRSNRAVREFARTQGLAPGIIVGMLQHDQHLPWSHLSGLKVRYEWQ